MSDNTEYDFWTASEKDKTEYCSKSKLKKSEYEIVRNLGSGSFGTVFLAKRSGDDNLYVLKQLKLRNPGESGRYGVKLEDIYSEINILKTISDSEGGCVKDILCYVDHFI